MPTLDPLNAFIDNTPLDSTKGGSGRLDGHTLAVKDIFDVVGRPTGCGNPQKLRESTPATRNAWAVQALLNAGAEYKGKTLTDELAFSLMGQNAHYPFPINPNAPDRVTGGSSCGSAAAVAGHLADIAIGSDTGGSIRAPASFCGLFGLRPTHSRISLEGVMPLAPSLDTVGWFTREIDSFASVGAILLGEDEQAFSFKKLLFSPILEQLLLGQSETESYRTMFASVRHHFSSLKAASQPTLSVDDLYLCFRQIQGAEAWTTHGEWISSGERELGPGVVDRFIYGSQITPDDLARQRKRRAQFRNELNDIISDDAVLALPTVPGAAPLANSDFDGLQAYREQALKLLCWSGLSGLPQISLPLGSVHNAPFAISLIGPRNSDRALIALAKTIIENWQA